MALPDNLKIKALSGLKKLILPGCPGLTALPAGLGALMRLEGLLLSYCSAQHTPRRAWWAWRTYALVLAFLRGLRD